MKQNRKEHTLPTVAALLVFAVFATGVLSVLLGGAGVYKRLTGNSQNAYDSRTCGQYLASRLRQTAADVSIADFGDGDALILSEQIGNEVYITRIYCYEGWLMELFCPEGSDLQPQDGQKVLPASQLSLQLTGGLLHARITPKDCDPVEMLLSLRSHKGVQP